jgi:WD40 repeat protein
VLEISLEQNSVVKGLSSFRRILREAIMNVQLLASQWFILFLIVAIEGVDMDSKHSRARLDTKSTVVDANQAGVSCLVFSSDGRNLVSGGRDGSLKLWETQTGKLQGTFLGHSLPVKGVAITANGNMIASGGWDKTVRVWDVSTSTERLRLADNLYPVHTVNFSPDSKMLAYGTGGHKETGRVGHVKIWNLVRGKEGPVLDEQPALVTTLAFSPDGKMLASGSEHDITLWELITGRARTVLKCAQQDVRCVVFGPDGRTLVSAHSDFERTISKPGEIILWDLTTGRARATLREHRGRVHSVTLSPDGKIVASSGMHGVKLWDVASAKVLVSFEVSFKGGNEESRIWLVGSLNFSPDGKMLACACADGKIRLWDVTTLLQQRTKNEEPLKGGEPRGGPLSGRSMRENNSESLWASLAGEDATKAFKAMVALEQGGDQTVTFVKERLRPVALVAREHIRKLILGLDNNKFEVRQAAFAELKNLGEVAEDELEKALKVSAEVRRQIDSLLAEIRSPVPPGEKLQALRTIEVLEHIETAGAQGVLKTLAQGAPQALVTREAKASLERLAKQGEKR